MDVPNGDNSRQTNSHCASTQPRINLRYVQTSVSTPSATTKVYAPIQNVFVNNVSFHVMLAAFHLEHALQFTSMIVLRWVVHGILIQVLFIVKRHVLLVHLHRQKSLRPPALVGQTNVLNRWISSVMQCPAPAPPHAAASHPWCMFQNSVDTKTRSVGAALTL